MVFLQIFGNPGFGQNYLGFTIRRFPGDFWFGFNLGGIPIYLINTGVTKRLAHLTNIYYPLLTVFDKSFTKNVKDKLFCVRFKYRVTVKVTKYAKKWGKAILFEHRQPLEANKVLVFFSPYPPSSLPYSGGLFSNSLGNEAFMPI